MMAESGGKIISKHKIFLILAGVCMMGLLGIEGKKYMEKRALEKDYQQGVELIQEYVTDYLVKNYEGIEKIEWQGVGIEWRSSPIYGNSIMGNYVNSEVKVFVSDNQFFTMGYTLTNETEYDDELEKYVVSNSLNPSNVDVEVEGGKHNAVYKYGDDPDVKKFDEEKKYSKVKKSSLGSPNAQVIYNLKIHELKY